MPNALSKMNIQTPGGPIRTSRDFEMGSGTGPPDTTVRKISALGNPLDLLTAYVILWTAPNQLSANLKF